MAWDWVQRNASKDNWFLYVNYWDPHTPYSAPQEFGNPFASDPLADWLTDEELDRHKEMVGSHCVHELNIDYHNKTYNNEAQPHFPRHPGEIPQEPSYVLAGIQVARECHGNRSWKEGSNSNDDNYIYQ
ncbi:hypothetical protein [Paenibacillus sp. LjRoot56]|uniref:hypothetical protein n=1 Tax=Paenibacillus sp. LjRoot56 TaxID=3342333 RepID=UPI003ECE5F85